MGYICHFSLRLTINQSLLFHTDRNEKMKKIP
jgi:hypothetical protein